MSKINSKVADTAPVRPVAGTETLEPATPFEPIIDTKEKHLGYIVPYLIEDIWNFEVFSRISPCGTLKFKNMTCSIAKLVQLSLTENTIIPDTTEGKFKQQIIFIEFYGELMETILFTALDNNLEPTFILDHQGYDYHNELLSSENFTFGYVFDKPITKKGLIDNICEYLGKVFSSYNCEVDTGYCMDSEVMYIPHNFINTILSHKIYIPLEGGIAHE